MPDAGGWWWGGCAGRLRLCCARSLKPLARCVMPINLCRSHHTNWHTLAYTAPLALLPCIAPLPPCPTPHPHNPPPPKALVERQREEAAALEADYQREYQAFVDGWQARVAAARQKASHQESSLLAKQAAELEALRLRHGMQALRPKFSNELLILKQKAQALARQREFDKAEQVGAAGGLAGWLDWIACTELWPCAACLQLCWHGPMCPDALPSGHRL